MIGAIALVLVIASGAGAFTLVRSASTQTNLHQVVTVQSLALQAAWLRSDFQVQHQKLKDVFLRGATPSKYSKYLTEFKSANATVVKAEAMLKRAVRGSHDATAQRLLADFDVGYAVYNNLALKAFVVVPTPSGFDFHPGDAIMTGRD